jgi:AraC family transcriptional regulator of adaptative response / DNA-3-methyladenine glycosylase II
LDEHVDDADSLYRAVTARDRRLDGRFVFAVTSTGIYCRPSCPARTPRRENVRYYPVPAAAVAAGFRACRRCRPDAVPGSRDWDHRGDLVARALRLVASGAVDDEGVAGLARRLSVSERHLHRSLVAELGVGPQALARTRRAQTARLLLDQTELSVTDVAFAAGFASIRQFNDVMRAEFGAPPSRLRGAVRADRPAEAGPVVLRLATRPPWAVSQTLAFLAGRAVPGVESVSGRSYRRSLRTPAGAGLLEAWPEGERLAVRLRLPALDAIRSAVTAVRRLFDLDADPGSVDDVLSGDPVLAPLVGARPGLRVPGTVDGFELAVRAVVGQQVSVAGARTLLGRVCERAGEPVVAGGGLCRLFPTPEQLAATDLAGCGLTGGRAATVRSLARLAADGDLDLSPGGDLAAQRSALLAVRGVGPWTADYVAMRALGDPDAFPAGDLVVRRVVADRALDPDSWRPWRAYAAMHLWTQHTEEPT